MRPAVAVLRGMDSIHHIAIHVADLARAVHWYTTSFECEVSYQDKTQAVLEFANCKLVLVLPSQQPPHVAFPRRDASTLGELLLRPDGLYSTYLSDPTGNVVEVIGEKPPVKA